MSRPVSSFRGELSNSKPQTRPSPPRRPGRRSAHEQQAAVNSSSAVLEKPSQQVSVPFRSFEPEEDHLSFDGSLIFESDLPADARQCPGFATYDEAEVARSRLPVHSLDLVPTITTRRCTVQMTARIWLDRQSRPSSGWYDTSSALGRFGQELAARACLTRADGSGQKYLAFIRDIWAIHEDEEQKVWHASYISADDKASLDDPIGRGFFTAGGPSWPLQSCVTLLAKAIDAQGEFWIKSHPTPISAEQ